MITTIEILVVDLARSSLFYCNILHGFCINNFVHLAGIRANCAQVAILMLWLRNQIDMLDQTVLVKRKPEDVVRSRMLSDNPEL